MWFQDAACGIPTCEGGRRAFSRARRDGIALALLPYSPGTTFYQPTPYTRTRVVRCHRVVWFVLTPLRFVCVGGHYWTCRLVLARSGLLH